MQPVGDFHTITSDLAIWHGYDPGANADLYSARLVTAAGTYLVDPIPVERATLNQLIACAPVAGVVVTNSNHHRAAAQLAEQFSVPIFAHSDTFSDKRPNRLTTISDGHEICDALRVIAITGAAPGEIVLHYARNGGTLIVGDALINFEPQGFAFLPAKYCSNQKQMRRSLRKLLDYETERILFAHGTPILSRAGEKLRSLLEDL